MTGTQEKFNTFLESVCSQFGCKDAIRPLQEGFAALCESITEPTMWLRKSYKNTRGNDCPDTPKFNQVWHQYAATRYDGSNIALDIAMENCYLVKKVVEQWAEHGEFPEICEKYKEDEDFWGMDEDELKKLMELDPETFIEVIIHSDEFDENDRRTLDFNHTVVNGWLVHNSDNAWDIWREGFRYGNMMGELAYSNAGSTAGKEYGDYLFAFPINEAPSPSSRGLKYGDASIVFIGTGNEFYHYGDEENQVIFDRREPKGCFIVSEEYVSNEDGEDEYWCVIGNNTHHPLYHSYDYEDCLNWISKNGNSFLKAMKMWNKATPGRQVATGKKIK